MGRKASHVALECTLQSHPNMVCTCFQPILACWPMSHNLLMLFRTCTYAQVILGEEVAASKLTIFDITKQICDAVQARAEKGRSLSLVYDMVEHHLTLLSFKWPFVGVLLILFTDKNHGVILIPEGLVESIPELYALLQVCCLCLLATQQQESPKQVGVTQ